MIRELTKGRNLLVTDGVLDAAVPKNRITPSHNAPGGRVLETSARLFACDGVRQKAPVAGVQSHIPAACSCRDVHLMVMSRHVVKTGEKKIGGWGGGAIKLHRRLLLLLSFLVKLFIYCESTYM